MSRLRLFFLKLILGKEVSMKYFAVMCAHLVMKEELEFKDVYAYVKPLVAEVLKAMGAEKFITEE